MTAESLVFSPFGGQFVSTSGTPEAKVWKISSGLLIRSLEHGVHVTVAFSANGLIATGDLAGYVNTVMLS